MTTRSRSAMADDQGQILILVALSLVALLGISALVLDASYMYDKRNRLHAAADAAAKSGAIEVRRDSTVSDAALDAFGNEQVIAHGFDPSGTTDVDINHPPTSGAYAGNASYVEAIVSEQTDTFFGRILGVLNMTPGARAVAGTSPGGNCIVTLASPGSSPASMSVGNSTLTLNSCSVGNAGNLNATNNNARIVTQSNAVTGSCSGAPHGCDSDMQNMQTGTPPPSDPLSYLAAPSNPGGCGPIPSSTATLTRYCITGGNVGNNTTLTFPSGIYYVTGPIILGNNNTLIGSGVMFYLAGTASTADCTSTSTAGCIGFGNSPTLNLSAPTAGTYKAILFYQNAANHLNFSILNSPTLNLSGAMYFPGANVSIRNGLNATNDCMLLVARSFSIDNGNGSFDNTCSAYGGSPISTVSLAE